MSGSQRTSLPFAKGRRPRAAHSPCERAGPRAPTNPRRGPGDFPRAGPPRPPSRRSPCSIGHRLSPRVVDRRQGLQGQVRLLAGWRHQDGQAETAARTARKRTARMDRRTRHSGETAQAQPPLCQSADRHFLVSESLQEHWRKAVKAAGLPPIDLYEGTKHSFATDAVRRGVPERSLQKFLGHASVHSTRRYTRLADEALLEVLRPPATASDKDSRTRTKQINRLVVGPPGFEPGSLRL